MDVGYVTYLRPIWRSIYNESAIFVTEKKNIFQPGGECPLIMPDYANIIQISAIGPAAYVVNAGDLAATVPGNSLCKFADDTYLIIPASNETSRQSELANIQNWAQQNNLKLNCSKSCEIIFSDRSQRRHAIIKRILMMMMMMMREPIT